MALPFKNEYNLKTVAEAAAKPCMVCLKPSSKVLITSDKKDRGFASPAVDEKVEAERRQREALQQEIDLVKKEYEEKLKKKKKDKKKDEKKKDDVEDVEKERDDKIKSLESRVTERFDDGPKSFVLHRHFYQIRVDRLRQLEMTKRNQERMRNPSFFPSVPSGDLSPLP